MITQLRDQLLSVTTDEESSAESPLDRVMGDIRRELVLRAAREDRDEHRDIYDALEQE